ncbi:MAG TPA: multicopper oxidase domain-containing protein [Opitutaceae bacterium]|nr:multicopper oxidase domain-containing protein [Opitutaceae bacterium]
MYRPSVHFARLSAWAFLAVLVAIFGPGGVRAQPASAVAGPPPAVPASPATVTPEMGDVGGKYFGHVPDPAKTRHYYIAAEPVLWDFAPEGQDTVCGKAFSPSLLLDRGSWKIRYVQYADANFSARVLPEKRLGILGPVLRGTTGQYLEVTFLNRAWLPLSMHPHGVKYDKDSEGSYYKPAPGRGAAVAPGAKFTYVWYLDEASGPGPDEPSSKAWLYHSHVTGDGEANLGLVGFIIVTDPARARPDGTPRDVDREMAALFKIFDESNLSGQADEEPDERPASAAPAGPVQRTWAETQQVVEESQRYTINGLVYGNLPGLEMNEGERVRWYLFGLGSENDFHTAHWHGLRVVEDGRRRTDVVELLPGSMKIADMVADNPGQWIFHCHVAEHMDNGMFARLTVYPAGQAGASRDPAVAFFGLPQSWQTLRLQTAEFMPAGGGAAAEIDLDGEVTVPDPFPVSHNAFVVQIGAKSLTLKPDASGIAASPEGILLIKNISPYGNGNVTGGRLNFQLTLKGAGWMDELGQLKAIAQNRPVRGAALQLDLQVGAAHHAASCALKLASQ